MIEVVHQAPFVYRHDHSRSCPHCSGQGFSLAYSEAYDYRDFNSPTVSTYEDCARCRGTGVLTAKDLDFSALKKEVTQS